MKLHHMYIKTNCVPVTRCINRKNKRAKSYSTTLILISVPCQTISTDSIYCVPFKQMLAIFTFTPCVLLYLFYSNQLMHSF